MLASARTFALLGIEAREVQVEVDVASGGLPSFSLVGLPDPAVRESRERVRSALVNSGFKFPMQRITANLAPADLRKAGPGFDLAIAAALLGGLGPARRRSGWHGSRSPASWRSTARSGRCPGILAMAEAARELDAEAIAVPAPTRRRPRWPASRGSCRWPGSSSSRSWARRMSRSLPRVRSGAANGAGPAAPDLADLRGQPYLRYALEVAAAGGHSLLIIGPPGAGKSLAARRLPSIMPPLAPLRGDGGAADRERLRPVARPGRSADADPSGLRTTRSRPPGWWVAARRRGPAR